MIIINFFPQVFNVSVSSAQRQIFVTAHVFGIMQFDMLQKCCDCSYQIPSTHWALEQGVKFVRS